MDRNIKPDIRECTTLEEFKACIALQKEVFALPDIEISPVRHLIVTKNAGGWSLGAFYEGKLIGFVLSVPAFKGYERCFYSHMTAVSNEFQGLGIGAKLKWAQRERALREGVRFIKWTFQPVQARNAFFNLERLGTVIRKYAPNFYGTDYATSADQPEKVGIDSDRLIAEWELESEKVVALSKGKSFSNSREPDLTIEIPNDWSLLVKADPQEASEVQRRIRREFESAFASGMICSGFERSSANPKYLLYKS